MNIASKALDVKKLRENASKALIALLWLHVPIVWPSCLHARRGTDWLLPSLFTDGHGRGGDLVMAHIRQWAFDPPRYLPWR